MRLQRVGAGLALALVISVVVGGGTAYGDKAYRTERLEFNLTPAGAVAGHPELRAGQFVNVHANGPVIYTQERFMLNGARPETVYQLVLRFQDGCEGPVLFDFPFVVLETDGHGNAHARNVPSRGCLTPGNDTYHGDPRGSGGRGGIHDAVLRRRSRLSARGGPVPGRGFDAEGPERSLDSAARARRAAAGMRHPVVVPAIDP